MALVVRDARILAFAIVRGEVAREIVLLNTFQAFI